MRKGKIEFENGSDKFMPKENFMPKEKFKIKPILFPKDIKDFSNKEILEDLFRRVENKRVLTLRRTKKEFDKFFKWIEENVKLGNEILDSFWHIYDQGKVQGLELYCPKCNFNKDGATLYKGLIAHACDPGCCDTVYCTKCGRVYGLLEDEKQKMSKDGMLVSKKRKEKRK